jgi:hypothetical protein
VALRSVGQQPPPPEIAFLRALRATVSAAQITREKALLS